MTEDYWEPVSIQPPYDAKEEPEPAPVFPGSRGDPGYAGLVRSGNRKYRGRSFGPSRRQREKKQIVTAAGKVIETDAEEIIRQKAEKRRRRRRQQRLPKRGRLPMPLCARRSRKKRKTQKALCGPAAGTFLKKGLWGGLRPVRKGI